METPPYQPDNYRRKSVNRNEAKKLGSLNENIIDVAEIEPRRSKHGSINDDQEDDLIEQEKDSNRTNSERDLDNQL